MRRTLWIGAAALLVAYLFVPWLIGFAVEKQSNASLELMKDRTPYVTVTANTFRRGWFMSEQNLTLELFRNLPSASRAVAPFFTPIQMRIHNVIWHGPICGLTCIGLARVKTRLSFGPPLQTYLASAFGAAEPLRIDSKMSFGGGGSGTLTSPAIKDAALPNGARIGWGGFELKSEFTADLASYSVRGSIPKFTYSSADGNQVQFDGNQLAMHAKRVLRTLFEGDYSVAIDRVSISSPNAGGAVLKDLRAGYSSAVNDGYMNIIVKNSIGSMSVASLNLNGAHIDFSLHHLQLDSLEQLNAAMQKVNQDLSQPPAQRSAALLAAIKRPGIDFLSHNPAFNLDRVSIASGGGEALLSGRVTLDGMVESDFAASADSKAVIRKLEADLDMSIDDTFLHGLPNGAKVTAQLQSFVDQGLATHAGGKFHTKMVFHEGVTTFDGKSLPQPPPSPSATSHR